jgi:hypothetical protein
MKPEACVQRAILDLLTVERIWHVRLNSRTVMLPGIKGRMRPVHFGSPGMADILAAPILQTSPLMLWIEVKAPKGKQSKDQKLFEQSVTEAGQFYLLARSSDDVFEWLRDMGIR